MALPVFRRCQSVRANPRRDVYPKGRRSTSQEGNGSPAPFGLFSGEKGGRTARQPRFNQREVAILGARCPINRNGRSPALSFELQTVLSVPVCGERGVRESTLSRR